MSGPWYRKFTRGPQRRRSCADPSVAWAVKIGSDSGYFWAFLEESAARELYPSIDYATAGQAPPNGRAVRVPGGYRVTGRWGFASGGTHADVMVGGCLIVESAGARSASQDRRSSTARCSPMPARPPCSFRWPELPWA